MSDVLRAPTPPLDDKGRLFLPAKFRDELSEGLVVTRGQERCLYVWPQAEFSAFTEQLREAPVTNKATRDYVRMFFAGASAETAGQAGPGHLPPMLREYAGAEPRVRRDRRDEPGGDLGRRRHGTTYSAEEEPFADWSEEVFPASDRTATATDHPAEHNSTAAS